MKTYKRELAVVLLVWFMYIVEVKDVEVIQILVWPVFTFSALSFGLDWFGKRLPESLEPPDRRGTKRSREYPDSQDSDPNLR